MTQAKNNKNQNPPSKFRKVVIGILNIICMYFAIMFSMMLVVFGGLAAPAGSRLRPTDIWLVPAVAYVCIIFLLLACAVTDLFTMAKLKHNPYNKKTMEIRKKNKKFLGILIILYICLTILTLVPLLMGIHF